LPAAAVQQVGDLVERPRGAAALARLPCHAPGLPTGCDCNRKV
jgi:hypothetical protein